MDRDFPDDIPEFPAKPFWDRQSALKSLRALDNQVACALSDAAREDEWDEVDRLKEQNEKVLEVAEIADEHLGNCPRHLPPRPVIELTMNGAVTEAVHDASFGERSHAFLRWLQEVWDDLYHGLDKWIAKRIITASVRHENFPQNVQPGELREEWESVIELADIYEEDIR